MIIDLVIFKINSYADAPESNVPEFAQVHLVDGVLTGDLEIFSVENSDAYGDLKSNDIIFANEQGGGSVEIARVAIFKTPVSDEDDAPEIPQVIADLKMELLQHIITPILGSMVSVQEQDKDSRETH
jgi:hypothetical protein